MKLFLKKVDIPNHLQFEYKIKYFIAIIKTTANKFLFRFIQKIKNYKFQSIRIQHLISDLIKFKLGLTHNPVLPMPIKNHKSFLVLPFTKYFAGFEFKQFLFSAELMKVFPSCLLYPKVTYILDLPFSKLAFNYREFGSSLPNVNEHDVSSFTCLCSQSEYSKFVNPDFGHIVTGDLDIVKDYHLRRCFSFGTKFRPVFHISKSMYFRKFCDAVKVYIIKYAQIYWVTIEMVIIRV